jgi:tetratricopeptide (TPR) repeat protein
MIPDAMPASLQTLEALAVEPGDRFSAVQEVLRTIVGEARQRALWSHLAVHAAQTAFSSPREAEAADNVLQARLHTRLSRLYGQCLAAGNIRIAAAILEAILTVCTGCNLDLTTLLETTRPEIWAGKLPLPAIPPNVHALLAYQHLRRKEPEPARRHVQALAPGGAPLSSTVFPSLCLALAENNMRPEGRHVASMSPPVKACILSLSSNGLFEHVGALLQLEDIPRVKQFLRAMDTTQYSGEQLGLIFSYMVRFEDPDMALRLAPRLGCKDQPWPEVHLYEALAYRLLFRYDDALAALDRDQAYNGRREANILYRAQFLWECNAMEEALAVLEAGLLHPDCDTDPTRGVLYNMQAVVLRSLGRLEQALGRHALAVACYPEFWRVYAEMALTLVAAGQTAKALDVATQGRAQGRFVNNFCEYLIELLGGGRHGATLSLPTARKCFSQAKHITTPWLPLQAHRILLALAAFEAHGQDRLLREAARDLRTMHGVLAPKQRAAVCDALERGAAPRLPEIALAFARGAFPHLPETGHDQGQLVALAGGALA